MNNLTLQQMEKLGISKWMNEKERNKAIEKALEEQKELITNDSHKEVFLLWIGGTGRGGQL